MAFEDPAQSGGHAGWCAGAGSGSGAVTGGGDPFPAADGRAEDESGPCSCGEAILCLGGEDAGDDDETAGFGGGGDAVEGEGEDVEEDVGGDDIVLLAGLPCGHVVLCEAEAAGAVQFGVAVGDADGGGVVIESRDWAGTEEGGGDAENARAAAEVEKAPWLEPVGVGVICDEAEAGAGGGVVACAEGHFARNGKDDSVRVEVPHFIGGFRGMADDEAAADGDGLEGGGGLGGPVACGYAADSSSEFPADAFGVAFAFAVDFDADGAAAGEAGDDEAGGEGAVEAFHPCVFPLGTAEF